MRHRIFVEKNECVKSANVYQIIYKILFNILIPMQMVQTMYRKYSSPYCTRVDHEKLHGLPSKRVHCALIFWRTVDVLLFNN